MSDLISITGFLQQQELFLTFKNQLQKDFESCGQSVDFIENLPTEFSELLGVITSELIRINKSSSGALTQLLYRIDISEKQIKEYLNKQNQSSFEAVISELIIRRILQKVVLKKFYSN